MTYTGQQQRDYQRRWIAKRRADFFADKKCVKCGSTDRMELDHIDRSTKVTHAIWSWSEIRRLEEIAKCQVLCHDCHKAKTKSEFEKFIHGTYAMRNQHKCKCYDCMEYVRRQKREWRAKQQVLGK